MEWVCRTCPAWGTSPTGDGQDTCPSCGAGADRGPVAHPELFSLTLAHVDLDAFYASVEKRDDPTLANRPVIVGGDGARGVVSTACYQARAFGVRSAMAMAQARKLCPTAAIRVPDMDRYRRVAREIQTRIEALTPAFETISLDEAWLDLSGTQRLHGAPPAAVLAGLQREVRTTLGLTLSVGLAHTPSLAKIASDLDKPDGFTALGPSDAQARIGDLPVRTLGGAGPRAVATLEEIGVTTVAHLRDMDATVLKTLLGESGLALQARARGADDRVISRNAAPASLSRETTLAHNTPLADLDATLWELCEEVAGRAKAQGVVGQTATLKIKTPAHRVHTRQEKLDPPTQMAWALFEAARTLRRRAGEDRRVRLVGIGLSGLIEAARATRQGNLLEGATLARREDAERALDEIRARFGQDKAFTGRRLG